MKNNLITSSLPHQKLLAQFYIFFTAEYDRRMLVKRCRLDMQNTFRAVARAPARLLDDVCHRVALVHKAEFPVGIFLVAGVCENSAV